MTRQGKSVFRVEYGSAVNRRVARFYVKAPYGSSYALVEALNRAYQTGQVRWFRIVDIMPGELSVSDRSTLMRWPDALRASSLTTKVVFGQ